MKRVNVFVQKVRTMNDAHYDDGTVAVIGFSGSERVIITAFLLSTFG